MPSKSNSKRSKRSNLCKKLLTAQTDAQPAVSSSNELYSPSVAIISNVSIDNTISVDGQIFEDVNIIESCNKCDDGDVFKGDVGIINDVIIPDPLISIHDKNTVITNDSLTSEIDDMEKCKTDREEYDFIDEFDSLNDSEELKNDEGMITWLVLRTLEGSQDQF